MRVPPNHPKLDYLSIETHRVGDPPIVKKKHMATWTAAQLWSAGHGQNQQGQIPALINRPWRFWLGITSLWGPRIVIDIEMDPSHPQKCWVLLTSWVWLTSHSWIIGRAPLPRHHMPDVCQNSGSPWGMEAGRRCQPVNQTKKKMSTKASNLVDWWNFGCFWMLFD